MKTIYTIIYTILDRKGSPLVYLLLTNDTSFTYLVKNFALTLLTAVNALSSNKMNKSQKKELCLNFFTAINVSVSPFEPFYRPKWQISLSFHIPVASKRYTFWAQLSCRNHYRDYPLPPILGLAFTCPEKMRKNNTWIPSKWSISDQSSKFWGKSEWAVFY